MPRPATSPPSAGPRPGAVVHLLCFRHRGDPPHPEHPPGCHTHAVSEAELRRAFAQGWSIDSLEAESWTEVVPEEAPAGEAPEVPFWLARIRRR
jgi:hypothetical protein